MNFTWVSDDICHNYTTFFCELVAAVVNHL